MKLEAIVAVLTFLVCGAVGAADLEKAKILHANGLTEEAKKELIQVAFDETLEDAERAEALLLLGDIAVEEKRYDAATGSWTKVTEQYAATEQARTARTKLDLLAQLTGSTDSGQADQENAADEVATTYEEETVLVVSSNPAYPWAANEIAGVLRGPTAVALTAINEAFALAKENSAVRGVVEVNADVDSAFESVRAVCFAADGRKVWQKKTSISWFGSQEQMARRMVSKVAKKVEGMTCP